MTDQLPSLSDDQFDVVFELQEEDSSLAGLSATAVADALKKRGHLLFADWGVVAEAPQAEAQVQAQPAAPAQPAIDAEAGTPPQLDAGPPQSLEAPKAEQPAQAEAAPVQVKAELVEESSPQVPARVEEPKQTQLATTSSAGAVEGMEHIDRGDLEVPELKIKQAQTSSEEDPAVNEVEDGNWFLSNDPEGASEERTLVFLDIRPGRTYMLPYEDPDGRDRVLRDLGLDDVVPADAKVLCTSSDRKTPDEVEARDWDPLSKSCEECPHAKWRQTSQGRVPPACGEVYRTIVLDVTEEETPARLFLKSSAIRPTRSLLTNLQLAARRRKLPVYGFAVNAVTIKKSGKNAYYVPKFGRPQALDEVDVEAYGHMRAELLRGEG